MGVTHVNIAIIEANKVDEMTQKELVVRTHKDCISDGKEKFDGGTCWLAKQSGNAEKGVNNVNTLPNQACYSIGIAPTQPECTTRHYGK